VVDYSKAVAYLGFPAPGGKLGFGAPPSPFIAAQMRRMSWE